MLLNKLPNKARANVNTKNESALKSAYQHDIHSNIMYVSYNHNK